MLQTCVWYRQPCKARAAFLPNRASKTPPGGIQSLRGKSRTGAMLVKSLVVAGLATTAASLPVTLSLVWGGSVTLAVGGVELVMDRHKGIDLDFDPTCFVQSCPIAELRIRESEEEAPAQVFAI
jgi:hypothetical protein